VTKRYTYEPYGAPANGTYEQGPGYTGHVTDALTGLSYMQQRYYDPTIGRFLSIDPVGVSPINGLNFNRYWYANNNPYRYTDPDGRNAVAFLGGVVTESWNAVNGRGFDGAMVMGALADGYNGEGNGFVSAAIEDASAVATVAGGVGALRAAGSLVKQTGEKIVSRLAKGAIKDDVKGSVRQIVKAGDEKVMGSEFAQAAKGAQEVKTVETSKGVVQTATHADGTTVSARGFSRSGRPTIQVSDPKATEVVKVRYENQ